MKELILSLLTGAIESVGETKLEAVLQKLHDNNPEQYEAAVKGGNALVIALTPLVEGTGTKIDDAIVKGLGDAIKDSAAANGVEL